MKNNYKNSNENNYKNSYINNQLLMKLCLPHPLCLVYYPH